MENNNLYIDFKSYVEAISSLQLNPDKYEGIIAVLRGGFYVADPISRKFNIPIHYFSCYSYNDNKEQGEIKLIDFADIEGGHYLIVDDIYDTGKTVEYIQKFYTHCTFDVYCLVSKQERVDIDYSFTAEKDTWVEFWWETLVKY